MSKKTILIAPLLVALAAVAAAQSGYITATWPNIGQHRPMDALQCATLPLKNPTQTWKCAATSPTGTNTGAAECLFVFGLTGQKINWRLEGKYDNNDLWTGIIVQKSPSCTGYLCNFVGVVQYLRYNTAYSYTWSASGHTGRCDIQSGQGGTLFGTFTGMPF